MERVAWLSMALMAVLGAEGVDAAPKVAVVYSSWSNYTFRDEYDVHLKTLGWDFERFENRDMDALIPRLGEFDIVISASVGNYEHAVDMAPYREDWLRFLQRGGLLLITDASYVQMLDLWTNRLGDQFALASRPCARHTRQGPAPDRQDFDPSDAILYVPRNLAAELRVRSNIWAHLIPTAREWRSPVTCADKQSLFVYQDVGMGCLAVVSYFSFRGQTQVPVATALLDNLWTHVQGLHGGLEVSRFELGRARPGEHEAAVSFRSTLDVAAGYEVSLAVREAGNEQPQTVTRTVELAPGGTADLRLPYTLTQREGVEFALRLGAAGKAPLILTQRQVVPPLLELRVPIRHVYPWQTGLAWSAAVAPEEGVDGGSLRAELLVDGARAVSVAPPGDSLSGKADVTGLPLGDHRLELRLWHGERQLGSAAQSFASHGTPRVYVRPDDLTTMVEGKPFFPLGFYHVSWPFPADDRLQFLREVAAAGFNTVHASLKQMDEWDPFLAEAENLNVMVITEFGVDRIAAIERYRNRKAVLAWNPGDEPDGQGVAPEEMLERHNAMKSADPEVPTYMTLCVPAAYERYAGMAEVIAPDPYPIRHASASTVPVYKMISQAVAAATPLGRPIWAIPQAFGYKDPGSWRVPTFAEERNMTYLALLAGAKGLIYYTYRDSGFSMRENPALWEGMKTLPAEVKALEPFLLAGTRTALETGQAEVFAGWWVAGERRVVCVVNAENTEAREVSVALPAGVAGKARNLFADRPGGMAITDGKLSGRMGPLEVHVYEVE